MAIAAVTAQAATAAAVKATAHALRLPALPGNGSAWVQLPQSQCNPA